jgi:hypothetical protein
MRRGLCQSILVHRPERGPEASGQAVDLDSRFPVVSDEAPPVVSQFAGEVVAVFLRGEQDEIGVAVEEHVSAIVAVLPHDRWEDVVLPALHRPLRRIRPCTERAIKLVLEDVGPGSGIGRRRGRQWHRSERQGPGLGEGNRGSHRSNPRHQHHAATIHLRHTQPIVRSRQIPRRNRWRRLSLSVVE